MSDEDRFERDCRLRELDAKFDEDKTQLSAHLGIPADDVVESIRQGRVLKIVGSPSADPFGLDAFMGGSQRAEQALQELLAEGPPPTKETDLGVASWAVLRIRQPLK